jgi:hypothetical protein
LTAVTLLLAFILGLFFLGTGALKLLVPHEQGRARIGWIGGVSPGSYRLAGWLEVAGSIGLMFPTMVQAFDWLTPIAAAGLALIMTGAATLHVRRKEWGYTAMTLALLAACVLVAVAALT